MGKVLGEYADGYGFPLPNPGVVKSGVFPATAWDSEVYWPVISKVSLHIAIRQCLKNEDTWCKTPVG
jgi:hypothetical protein